jgi:MurNAc alpha-1-phosphate uridylyltransferase
VQVSDVDSKAVHKSFPVAILAGGKATRLRELTLTTPKSLLDICGEPFAVRQIQLLREHGLRDFVFCLGHMGDQVRAQLGNGDAWGVRIDYVFDGATPLGTGGALRKALPLLSPAFAVLYGDSYLPCDFQSIIRAFWASGKDGLMTVFRNSGQWDRSNVAFVDGAIRRYSKESASPEMQYIDYGLGMLKTEALERYAPDRELDLAAVYQDLLARDQLAAFEVKERFYEIGSVAGLQEMREYFSVKGCN